jgi:hypothetical protein
MLAAHGIVSVKRIRYRRRDAEVFLFAFDLIEHKMGTTPGKIRSRWGTRSIGVLPAPTSRVRPGTPE